MRIAFFGTPDFAVPTLEALAGEHEIALVVAQPDKPVGRGMKIQSPAVALKARELGLPLMQPARIRSEEFLSSVTAVSAEIGIVVAYGKILPATLLGIPSRGFLNVHASALPQWRGAAPIQRVIAAGEKTTGVTIMRVDEELDHGPMLAIETLDIGPDERTPQLSFRLSRMGGQLLTRVLRDLDAIPEIAQDHSLATYAAKIEKQEGHIAWSDSARSIYDRFRAFDPWPGVFTDSMKLTEIALSDERGVPGTILKTGDDGVLVACGDGAIRLIAVQRPGKPRVAAADLARSRALML